MIANPTPCRSAGLSLLTVALAAACVAVSLAADAPPHAALRIRAGERSPHAIGKFITGKFTEHLGNNVYNGLDAQILRNPTFAAVPFWSGQHSPDGPATFHWERAKIVEQIRRRGPQFGWPEATLDRLVEDHDDALAGWWARIGSRGDVALSPDTAPFGQRAQRVEVRAAGQGIAQWTYLPIHRVRKFAFELFLRSPSITSLTVSLSAGEKLDAGASVVVPGISSAWSTLRGVVELNAGLSADTPFRFAMVSDAPGQLVIGHAFLWPADHVDGADPDVIRLLKESRLPLMRWPGGNFVSAYHWEDGVGAVETRATRPNFAWGGVEPNTFGTHEFIALCRAIGCEPMICVNAGDGTPEDAARWIEYCNGTSETPMGKLRAAHGHPEPYRVEHWEIGNELWGKWQVNWTTAAGYVDRHGRFAQAMRKADPNVVLYSCGAPVFWGKDWNDTLIAGVGASLRIITDHPLIGGNVSTNADPLDVFRDFMAVPGVLEEKWAALRQDMRRAGIRDPRLAVTELQLFAHLGGAKDSAAAVRLTHANLVSPGTLAEALYDVLVYHACVRLAPFAVMVTHSATVNHGGGLRKERERVYANPCHHAQSAFAEFAGAVPVAIELDAPSERAPLVLPELRNVAKERSFKTVDALAAVAPGGDLLISVVHAAGAGTTRLSIELTGFACGATAQVRTLSAAVPWAANSLEQPDAVRPLDEPIAIRDGRLTLELKPYAVLRIRVPKAP